MAVIPIAFLSFHKINKISFFDHFFKVIEEVELRNSHELEEVVEVRVVPNDTNQLVLEPTEVQLPLIWISLQLVKPVFDLPLVFSWDNGILPSFSVVYHLLSPVRAP
ncbi:MAG: hypothetical protein AAFY71_24265 [Bacteroidota bacterium]